METVKVDMQKLQLLNDRITQTIEALNQLRMSVNGIQHTPATYGGYGYGQVPSTPFGMQSYGSPYVSYGQPFAQPYVQPFAQPFAQPFVPGIQHTPATGQWTTPQWTTPQWTTPQWTTPQWATSQWTTPWTLPHTGNGISHTTWDPTWQTRTPFVGMW